MLPLQQDFQAVDQKPKNCGISKQYIYCKIIYNITTHTVSLIVSIKYDCGLPNQSKM